MNKEIPVSKNTISSIENINMEAIANQLRCPEGKDGKVMGDLLNSSNIGMIKHSIKALELTEKNRIIELGHGSCMHLKYLLNQSEDLKYFGMEISELMKQEAEEINNKYTKKRQALFQLYDGININYVSNFFDRVLTVNTIYFIENPLDFINEMYRVLKSGGTFVISFVDGNFMKNLPFVANTNIFNLYSIEKVKKLITKTGFILNSVNKKEEKTRSKTGELVNRTYYIVTLNKGKKAKQLI